MLKIIILKIVKKMRKKKMRGECFRRTISGKVLEERFLGKF